MRAIRLCFFQMLACMRRDMMLVAACVAPLLFGLVFRFGIPLIEKALVEWLDTPAIISPYYELIDIFFSMITPVMFCFVAAMVALEEKDEGTAKYLFTTPLGKAGYLLARFGMPCVAALAATIVLLPVFMLSALSAIEVVLLSLSGALQGVLIAMLIVTLSSNKLEGMAVTKLSTLCVLGVGAPFFIKQDIQYALSALPSFWIGKAMLEKAPLYMLAALGLSLVWIWLLMKKYLRKM